MLAEELDFGRDFMDSLFLLFLEFLCSVIYGNKICIYLLFMDK